MIQLIIGPLKGTKEFYKSYKNEFNDINIEEFKKEKKVNVKKIILFSVFSITAGIILIFMINYMKLDWFYYIYPIVFIISGILSLIFKNIADLGPI